MTEFLAWLRAGAPQAEAANIERSLQHSWPWPPWVALAVLLLASALVVWLYSRQPLPGPRWRRAVLPALRILALLLVVQMMHGWTWQRFRTDLPDLLLIVDDSASMLHADARGESGAAQPGADGAPTSGARIERVRARLLEDDARRLTALRQRYHVRLFFVADRLRDAGETGLTEALAGVRIDPRWTEQSVTRLGDAVAELLRQQRARPTAAILLLTDGVTTAGRSLSDAAEEARRRGVPLWLAGVGDDRPDQDLWLSDLVYPTQVFPGDIAPLDAKLHGPHLEGRHVNVRLLNDGQVLDQQEVTMPTEGAAPVRLNFHAERPGQFALSLEVELLQEESNPDNNRLRAVIQVRDETIRVLMLQDHPSFDFQFLKTLLGRGVRRDKWDKAFDLKTVLQDSDPEHALQDADATRVFPVSRDELMAYDIVILGDADPRGLSVSQLENVVAFVAQRGGALVMLSGPQHSPSQWRGTPLEDLLPIDLATASTPPADASLTDGFQPVLTPLGAELPHLQLASTATASEAIWRQMPRMYWSVQATPRPGVRVLLERPADNDAAAAPLVCSRFYGAGMVLYHGTDESYRWSAHPAGREPYARYWLQTLRHLSRAKLGETGGVELSPDADTYSHGAPVRLRVRFLDERLAPPEDDAVLVVVEGNGRRRQLRLQRVASRRGHFAGELEGLPAGRYRAWLAAPTLEGPQAATTFQVSAAQDELAHLRMDSAELRRAAKVSGGGYAELSQLDTLLEQLPAGRQPRLSPLPPRPLWNSNALAALLVGTLLSEWLLRRRSGLA